VVAIMEEVGLSVSAIRTEVIMTGTRYSVTTFTCFKCKETYKSIRMFLKGRPVCVECFTKHIKENQRENRRV
jgi:formylmethanofuran dehydrogenase subunit E